MIFLEDGEMAVLTKGGAALSKLDGTAVDRAPRHIDWSPVMAEKSGYKHFMLKEIFEQPRAMEDTLRGRLDRESGLIRGEEIGIDEAEAKAHRAHLSLGLRHELLRGARRSLLSRGVGRHPGRRSSLRASSEAARPVITDRDLVIAVSQSGETARHARGRAPGQEPGRQARVRSPT